MKFRSAFALLLAISFLAILPARGQQVIYNNSSSNLNVSAAIPTEYGESIILGGTAREVTAFAFEYFGKFFSQGDEYAQVRFYREDGGSWRGNADYPMPKTVIWDSGLFPVMQGYNTKLFTTEFALQTVVVPNSFVWTIQFFGLTQNTAPGAEDHAGLLYYYFPTVGLSYNDIWEKRTSGWEPTASNDPKVTKNNFNAYLAAVPEPSIVALGGIGLGICAWRFKRRRATAQA